MDLTETQRIEQKEDPSIGRMESSRPLTLYLREKERLREVERGGEGRERVR